MKIVWTSVCRHSGVDSISRSRLDRISPSYFTNVIAIFQEKKRCRQQTSKHETVYYIQERVCVFLIMSLSLSLYIVSWILSTLHARIKIIAHIKIIKMSIILYQHSLALWHSRSLKKSLPKTGKCYINENGVPFWQRPCDAWQPATSNLFKFFPFDVEKKGMNWNAYMQYASHQVPVTMCCRTYTHIHTHTCTSSCVMRSTSERRP